MLDLCLETSVTNLHSNQYKLTTTNVSSRILQVTDVSDRLALKKKNFLKLTLVNKRLDAIYLSNILHHKLVKPKTPSFFIAQSVPMISISYNILSYRHVMQDLNSDILNLNLLNWTVLVPHSFKIRLIDESVIYKWPKHCQ